MPTTVGAFDFRPSVASITRWFPAAVVRRIVTKSFWSWRPPGRVELVPGRPSGISRAESLDGFEAGEALFRVVEVLVLVVSLSMTELLAVLVLDSYIIEEVVGMQ